MSMEVYIIGAGPAGCATALALQQRVTAPLSITLVTGVDTSQAAIGETIPPAAAERLRELLLDEILDHSHLVCPGSVSVWGSAEPGYNDFMFTPVGRGYHLDRTQFNQQLQAACSQRGIRVLRNTKITAVEQLAQACRLRLQTDNGALSVDADFVVDATGIQASVARSLGVARNEYDSVVSLCAFYTLPKTTQSIARTLVSATANGWWYGTQLPGQRALVSFCTDAQTLKQLRVQTPRRWFAQLCQVPWFKQACEAQFDLPLHQPAALHARAAPSAILSNCVGKRWLAVGDAAASYDSITSAGITKALDQGIAAGRAIATTLAQQDTAALAAYQRKIFADFGQYLNLHQQLYSAEQRFTESGFWQRRMLA